VVGKFVEFFGEGNRPRFAVPDRATIANMAPEYGATMGFFPVDGRDHRLPQGHRPHRWRDRCVRVVLQAQGLYGMPRAGEIDYTKTLHLDLFPPSPVGGRPEAPAGSHRAAGSQGEIHGALQQAVVRKRLFRNCRASSPRATTTKDGVDVGNGDVLIAAITSCTNTSNPGVLLAAGLLAKKAVERGPPPSLDARQDLARAGLARWSPTTSLAPGSCPTSSNSGSASRPYGCTTCIGNAGDLTAGLNEAIASHDLVCARALGQPQFRSAGIQPNLKANFPRLAAAGGPRYAIGRHGA